VTAAGAVPAERAQAALRIDLAAIQNNWRLLRDRVAPADCAAVIKADAYGTGLEHVAAALANAGCSSLFVAQIDEGLRARAALASALPRARLFVLNGLAGEEAHARACADADLVPVIGCDEDAALWAGEAKRLGKPRQLALMFDTGMNRLGFDRRRAGKIAAWLAGAPLLRPVLVASHFIASQAPQDARNALQIERFEELRRAFPGAPASLANSSGVFLPQQPFYDQVRPGYALYGGNPTPGAPNPMAAVVRLEAAILQIREVEAGETVGYDGRWTARRTTRLATIGVGYADGLPRSATGTDSEAGGEGFVAGERCPIVGRVSMDLTVIDVTDVAPGSLAPGARVELLGDHIGVDDLAARSGTIGYEILTNLGRRYARSYVSGTGAHDRAKGSARA